MKSIIIAVTLFISTTALANNSYVCQVIGEHRNLYNDIARVSVSGLVVEVDSNRPVLFGRLQQPEYKGDSRPEVMPWAISIRNRRDGAETPLVLSLHAPNQNAVVGTAYSQAGSKYIGFILGSHLEAICKKINY